MPKLNVCISGAAGNIAHSLFSTLGSGELFGQDSLVDLRLLELPEKMDDLKVIKMQLEDCNYKNIQKISLHCDPNEAFQQLDIALLLGGTARKPGMERRDLFEDNRKVFQEQGKALNIHAKKTCKILVIANPANTNCYTLALNAPNIPKSNFTCLMRLDHNRAVSQAALKLDCANKDIKNVIVWGNHSTTVFPDLSYAKLITKEQRSIEGMLGEDWIRNDYVTTIQKRGGNILKSKGLSSSISAAIAIIDHMRDWRQGSKEIVSMGVLLKESVYGVEADLCFCMPVICKGNYEYEIVSNLELNEYQKKRIRISADELIKEKALLGLN